MRDFLDDGIFDGAGFGGEVSTDLEDTTVVSEVFTGVLFLVDLVKGLLRGGVVFQLYDVDKFGCL